MGFIVGAVDKDRLLTPDTTRPGDVLLGLPSSGLHTNGYSLVRSVFDIDDHPDVLASVVPDDGRTLGEALLAPHRQYLAELRPVLARIKGLAHITGGGFYKNVPRSLASRPSGRDRRQHVVRAAIVPPDREPGRGDR